MLSSRSTSIATQPIPPSDIATFRFGKRTAYPDQSHSAHALNDIWPNIVAPSWIDGASFGIGYIPDEPTCSEMTVSVSAHAAMIGSQYRSKIDGNPMFCGRSGNVTERNPRAALRR